MKKSIALITCLLTVLSCLAGCACKHSWIDATCTEAAVCELCGLTEGEPLGHQEVAAESSYDFIALTEQTGTVCEACGEALSSEVQPLTVLHAGGLFLCDREEFIGRYQALAEELGYRVVLEESGHEHEKLLELYAVDTAGTGSERSLGRYRFAFHNEWFPEAEDGKFHMLFTYREGETTDIEILSMLFQALLCAVVCDPTLIEEGQAAMDSGNATDFGLAQMVSQLVSGEVVTHNGLRYTLDGETGYFIVEVIG